MKRILLALAFLIGSVASAFATCTSPATMHDFPGSAFLMSLATVPDGNCGSNVAVPSWAGGTLGAMANYGTSPGAVLVPGVNASVTASVLPTGAATSANQSTEITSLATIAANTGAAVPAGTNVIGFTSNDPCSQATKLGAAINLTASGQLITGAASKKTYICAINLVTATAQNIALVEGTGTTCATNIFGLAGGTTAATGWNFAANGGLTLGTGGTVISPSADANGTAANVCLLLSSTGQTSGQIVYVQQ